MHYFYNMQSYDNENLIYVESLNFFIKSVLGFLSTIIGLRKTKTTKFASITDSCKTLI